MIGMSLRIIRNLSWTSIRLEYRLDVIYTNIKFMLQYIQMFRIFGVLSCEILVQPNSVPKKFQICFTTIHCIICCQQLAHK